MRDRKYKWGIQDRTILMWQQNGKQHIKFRSEHKFETHTLAQTSEMKVIAFKSYVKKT